MLKILNLYAGIGGNRKLWTDVEVTAVELNPEIAAIYSDFFPSDTVIVTDAHDYLLQHYKEFDFIWSSPPCQSHSRMRRYGVEFEQYQAIYPDLSLYQEILLLDGFFKGKYVVENVKPYYKPLVPATEIDRHLFWSNFIIENFQANKDKIHNEISSNTTHYGFNLNGKKTNNRKDQVLRNLVNPEIGLYILNCARNILTRSNLEQLSLYE